MAEKASQTARGLEGRSDAAEGCGGQSDVAGGGGPHCCTPAPLVGSPTEDLSVDGSDRKKAPLLPEAAQAAGGTVGLAWDQGEDPGKDQVADNVTVTHTHPSSSALPSSPVNPNPARAVSDHYWEAALHIGACAALGMAIRSYCERLFGRECGGDGADGGDFWAPVAEHVCVTTSGRTTQTGGGLFYDLPGNMVGCLLMGLISPPPPPVASAAAAAATGESDEDDEDDDPAPPRIPWLDGGHPLQLDEVYYTSLGTGVCGGLTTFASWNTQMVVMLDGTYTELGPYNQIVTVLFGYVIGLASAIAAFVAGRHAARLLSSSSSWVCCFHRPTSSSSCCRQGGHAIPPPPPPEQQQQQKKEEVEEDAKYRVVVTVAAAAPVTGGTHIHQIALLVLSVAMLAAFVAAGFVADIDYYKNMTLAWLFAPVGAWMRWRLAELNVHSSRPGDDDDDDNREIWGCRTWLRRLRRLRRRVVPSWLPLGTVVANLVAVTIGAVATGIDDRYTVGEEDNEVWADAALFAVNVGLCGCLSTVSTMVRETVLLADRPGSRGTSRAYAYSCGTCLAGMLWGLAVYATTIRVGGS